MANVFCKFRCLRAVLTGITLLASTCAAQTSAPIPQTVEDVLHQMSDKADVIFVGQVIAVHPSIEGGTASGTVAIDFHIDQAVRGCSGGVSCTNGRGSGPAIASVIRWASVY